MADNFALALQKGLRTRLAATTDLTNIVSTRIFDEPPQGVTFPYVRFGDITPAAFDTDTELGAQVSIGIECHSRSASGRVEAVQMVEAIKQALHRQETNVTVTNYNVIELIFQTYSAQRDSEGRGYTAVIALLCTLEDA
mgnify:FL=1